MIEIDLRGVSFSRDRAKRRKELIGWFLEEDPGAGSGDDASRYAYLVDSYGDYEIWLFRPAPLNKGIDFIVRIAGVFFKKKRRYNNPGHEDITKALNDSIRRYPKEKKKITRAIRGLYEYGDADLSDINASFRDFENAEHPIQVILLATKWLFMEQDCTYWNYSGHAMLFNGIMAEVFSDNG